MEDIEGLGNENFTLRMKLGFAECSQQLLRGFALALAFERMKDGGSDRHP